jgi:LmbE family N-acetylglucosaminyl deacetylase
MAREGAPLVMIFSPHPDDECIVGALPRRLQRAGWRVLNVAVTLGSAPGRRDARARELANACRFLGWQNHVLGWEAVTPTARAAAPEAWSRRVEAVAELLRRENPRVVLRPHALDGHPAHAGVQALVDDALAQVAARPALVETEYWRAMEAPNLLVECPDEDLADLVAALAMHQGEVERNPYHLTLPAWMIDNVRRGAERVGRAGDAAPGFVFGTLYRVEPGLAGDARVLAADDRLPWDFERSG